MLLCSKSGNITTERFQSFLFSSLHTNTIGTDKPLEHLQIVNKQHWCYSFVVNRKNSIITRVNWSPAKLFTVSMFFFAMFGMMTVAKFGYGFTIIPDALFLILLVDSIVTKLRDVRKGAFINEQSPADSAYDHLIATLNSIKHGSADTETKKKLSAQLIDTSDLSNQEKHNLLQELQKVYSAPEDN